MVPSPEATSDRGLWWDFLETIVPALLLAVLIQAFLAQATRVEGFSMEPTLYDHQRLIIEKVSYHLHPPQRGDIVVVRAPQYQQLLVKRVVGLPGETLSIRDGQVYINGTPLEEPYIQGEPWGNYPPTHIPEGYVFLLGDNRNNSSDSRVFGPVPITNILGHVWVRYWPLNDFAWMP